jgi:DNA-directed RNA polymerase subunit H (RpoH/RPB5)
MITMAESAIDKLHDLNLAKYFTIYNNVHTMLKDRGYRALKPKKTRKEWISEYLGNLAELNDDAADVDIYKFIDLMVLLFKRKKSKLLVYFYPLASKLCQSDMNHIYILMRENKADELIIISNNKATPKVSSVIDILGENVQLFDEKELEINPTRHQLVPEFTLLSGERLQVVKEQYAKGPDGEIHLDVFPGMFTCDPIAKWYNYKINDIVEIRRPREHDNFTDISYRTVIMPITDRDKGS